MRVEVVKVECLDVKMDLVFKNFYAVTVTLTVHSMKVTNWIVDASNQDRLDLLPLVSLWMLWFENGKYNRCLLKPISINTNV